MALAEGVRSARPVNGRAVESRGVSGLVNYVALRVRLGLATTFDDARSTLASTEPRDSQLAAQMHVQLFELSTRNLLSTSNDPADSVESTSSTH